MTEEFKLRHALDAISKRQNGSKALEILSIITYFAPENIHTETLSCLVSDENELVAAIQLLKQYSIVYLGQDKTIININRTAQKIMITVIETQNAKLEVLEKILALFFIEGVNSNNLDHAMSVWDHVSPHKHLIEKFSSLPSFILIELNKQVRYKEGEVFGWKALDSMNKTVGKSHSGVVILQHNIGALLGMAGKHKKALELLIPLYDQNTAHSSQKAIRDTLISIARHLGQLSRFKEALKIYEESLLCNQKVSDANDDVMLSAWHSYARVLCDMGKYHRASEILKEILKRRSQIVDKEDDDTLSLKGGLAHILIKEGKYSEALQIFYVVFEERCKIFGENHIVTLRTTRDIALVFQHQNRLTEALVMFEEVTEKFKQVLGSEHLETLAVQANLATLFQQKGEFQKALDTYKYIHKKQCETIGERHADSLRVKYHIATILVIQKKPEKALKLLQEIHQAYLEVFGPKHPETLEVKDTLEALRNVHVGTILETIHSAVWEGNLNKVKSMIQSGIDINNSDLYKRIPLHYAAQFGHVSIVKYLLEKGSIYNAQDEEGHTPVQVTRSSEIKNLLISVANLIKDAKEGNDEKISKYIAEQREILNAKDNDGSNALHWAAHNGHKDTVKLLLESGAEATQVTNKGNTPLHIATSKDHREIIEILLQLINRDDLYNFINAKTAVGGVTSIHVAARNGSLDIVKSLLKHGAIYNVKDKQGKTPLEFSKDRNITNLLKLSEELFQDAENGNHKIISKLQHVENDEFTALTSARNDEGNTLLQVIITRKHENIASQFLEMVKKRNQTESWPSSKWSLDQLEKLKAAAKLHIEGSRTYLPMLRSMSHPYDSDKNSSHWKTLKEGSYYLANAHKLVEDYKACIKGSIDNENIQTVNASLVELQFDPKHMTVGYTDEAYGGQVECFISKGQGTKYYNLLHSKLKKDVRLFVETVERNIDLPVKRFLESLEQKLQSVVPEKLSKATRNKNCTGAENCVKQRVSINSKNLHGGTPLHYAVSNGDIRIVNYLLVNGADVTQVTTKGNTPLHIATSKGHKEIVDALLRHASPDKLNEFVNAQTTVGGTTSLHVAARNGSVDIVKTLLKHGAIFNIENKEGQRPIELSQDQNIINLLKLTNELFHGAKDGNPEIFIKLEHVEHAEFLSLKNTRDNQGHTLLQVAIINERKNIVSKLLEIFKKRDEIQSWSSIKSKLNKLKTLFSSAQMHIQFSEVHLPMLRSMSHPNESEKNYSPWKTLKEGSYYLGNAHRLLEMYKSCMNGVIDDKNIQAVNDTLVKLEFHPKYNSSGFTDEAYGGTAQCFVSKGQGKKYYEILHSELNKDVRLFIEMVESNIDIPVKNFIETMREEIQSIFFEQLSKAIENNNHKKLEDCIKEGMDINSQNSDGGTPLHYAVNNGNICIINILLQNGADVTQVTSKGNNPLHIATAKGQTEIVQVLLQLTRHDRLNSLINAQTTVGGTASLHVAAKNGFIDIVKSLLKHGAIYNIKTKEGKTPLDLSKHGDVRNLLKRIEELFRDARNGDSEIVNKLQHAELDEFTVLTNAHDNEGNSLLHVAINNKYKHMSSKFVELFKNPDKIESLSSPKCKLKQFETLQEVGELYTKASQLYLLKLRSMSQPCASEKNSSPLITLKDGSCYLKNAYSLVKIYEWCTNSSVDDENIQLVNDTLIALEFGPEHLTFYANDVYNVQLKYLDFYPQGTQHCKLLHSESKKDVRSFIDMVERNIEVPVKKFLESIEQKLQYVLPEKLFAAIENNNLSEVEDHIRNGADINSKNTNGRTPLHYAVHNGNLEIINLLLKNGADATQVTIKGNTPLHIATSKGHKEIVEVLLQHRSCNKSNDFINTQTVGGTTSLHVAVKNGSWDMVISLLKHGAIYNKKNREGQTPIDLSKDQNITNLLKLSGELFQDAKKGNLEIISKLQRMGLEEFIALTNACNEQGNTLLQVAAINNHKNIASKLSAMLEKPDQSRSWFTPKLSLDQIEKLKEATELYIRCSQSYLSILRNTSQSNRSEKNSFPWATLKAGSCYLQNVHKLLEVYKEYMHGSIDDKNIQAVNHILVELEFDPKHITSGYTDEAFDGKVECFVSKGQGTKYYELLHSNLKKDVRSFVELVQSNVDIHVKRFLKLINQKFQLALSEMLFVAIENNNNVEVKNCLKEELVVNLKSIDGRTPLHYAVNNGNMSIINTLLKHGADISQVANNHDTSLHIASSKGHKRIVEVLLQHICHDKLNEFINAQMIVEGTSLHIAAKNGFLEVVESLLKHGAIYNIKNHEGKTPLDLSTDENVTNLLQLVQTLFEDAKSGNFKIMRKLQTQPFKFTAITNTRNDQGKSLVQVAVSNKHQGLAAKLEMIIKTRTNSTEY